MAGEEIATFILGVISGPVVKVYTGAPRTKLAQKLLVALLQDRSRRSRAVLSAALFPFSLAICFLGTWRCVFNVAMNTDVGSARNEQVLCTRTFRWECVSRGVSKHMCNSNPLLVWLWAGGVMCEFRGYMCTSFQGIGMSERQVFAGDFRRVLKLQSAFQCWIIFMGMGLWSPEKKWKTRVGQIKPECLCMRGTWAGLCIFKNPLPAVLEDCRTSFVGGGRDYSAVGNGVQCLTQSGTTTGLFLCFQITIEVRPNPGNQSRFPKINPRAARTLSMKRNWPFAFWSHRIPTNAVSSSALAGSPPQPRLRRQFINSTERAVLEEVRASPPPAPQNTGSPPPHFLLEVNLLPRLTKLWDSL